ncbi:vacuolar protein sorting-associated protein 18 homolog isoform X2 [Artemia franciscana]|uniref:vacuolar protein sorting-associated protein 18 homolog isoform X2 n=1 Tax=Artemia franciscana TaxID=6661 RepID=UPI0032DB5387
MEEKPFFTYRKIQFVPKSQLVDVSVGAKHLAIGLQNKTLLKIQPNQMREETITENDLTKSVSSSSIVHRVFLDPTGQHILVSLSPRDTADSPAELLYMKNGVPNEKLSKPRLVSRAKGQLITAVGWNPNHSSDESTGPILLGTKNGLLFETELKSDEGFFQSGIEQYFKQIFDVGKGQPTRITGIEFHQCNRSDGIGYFIFVTTMTRFYQFIGSVNSEDTRPLLVNVMNMYLNMPEKFWEFPSSDVHVEHLLKTKPLQIWKPHLKLAPSHFAWLTTSVIVCGKIDVSSDHSESVVQNRKSIHFESFAADSAGKPLVPRAIGLTEFHLVLLYSDRVVAVCILNEQPVYETTFREVKFLGMTGFSSGHFWAYSDRSVYEYSISDEKRNMWRVYMDLGRFDEAKSHCRGNESKLNTIMIRQAEHLLENRKFEESAKCFAETKLSFEEITLKFLELKQTEALRVYLLKRLSMLKPEMVTQASLIVLWSLELFLQELGTQRDAEKLFDSSQTSSWNNFKKFIKHPQVHMTMKCNKKAVYNLISSHGDKSALLECALEVGDYYKVLDEYVQENQYKEALEFLEAKRSAELYYRYIGPILVAIPEEAFVILIKIGHLLNPSLLLPSLTACAAEGSSKNAGFVVRYLEHCIKKLDVRDPAIHHFLLSLLVKESPEKVLVYLQEQGNDPSEIPYCLQTALRICLAGGPAQDRSLIWLYRLLERYEESVEKALSINAIDLAKETANQVVDDDVMRKRLWLKIARHIIEEENDISRALQMLQSCEQLKLEEVLPFFPDFTTIDLFRGALCSSLQAYSDHLDQLKEEMDEATKSAEAIRQEISIVKSRPILIKSNEKCSICHKTLLISSVYIFPCSHHFHADCLEAEVLPQLSGIKKERIHDLKRQLASLSTKDDTSSIKSGSKSEHDTLKEEIDEILAGDCLYCGDLMIDSVDKPFSIEDSLEVQLRQWS